MTNKQKIAIAAASNVAVFLSIWYVGTREATLALFPEVDRKIGKKVHAEMLREGLAGKYKNITTDEQYALIFSQKVAKYTSK